MRGKGRGEEAASLRVAVPEMRRRGEVLCTTGNRAYPEYIGLIQGRQGKCEAERF